MRNCKYLLGTCVALLLIIPFSQDGFSQRKTATNGTRKAKDETHRAMKAAEVLTEMMAIPEHRIPEDLMNRAHGIAVIPHVVDGAFGVGASGDHTGRRQDGRRQTLRNTVARLRRREHRK